MKTTNHHLIIRNNNQEFYFYKDWVTTGDIIRIGGYRTVIIDKKYEQPYIELIAILINENEIVVEKNELR
jgi:hypothetical protein